MTTYLGAAAVLAGLAGLAVTVMTAARAASRPASSAHRVAPSLILTRPTLSGGFRSPPE
jgi:hypothetical protein